MCPCSQNDPTYGVAFLGVTLFLAVYALLRWLLKGQNPFLYALGPLAAGSVVAGGVWYAGQNLAASETKPFKVGADTTVCPPPPGPVTRPADEEREQSAAGTYAEAAVPDPEVKVLAYYFHRTLRCPTCLSIENQAREAIEAGFSEEMAAGRLEWHAVNIEEEGNERFEDDFALTSFSLILVEMQDDNANRWKNLERVWELSGDPPGFQGYIWMELTEFFPE